MKLNNSEDYGDIMELLDDEFDYETDETESVNDETDEMNESEWTDETNKVEPETEKNLEMLNTVRKNSVNNEFKDFKLIMKDYHSGVPSRVAKAKEDACKTLEGFIAYIISKNYHTYCNKDFADLMQCGYIGVLTGLPKYNPDIAMPTSFFKTYIKCEISKYITEFKHHNTIHYAAIMNKINKAMKYLESLGVPYNATTIAEYCNISLVSVNEALAHKDMTVSVNYQDEFKNTSTYTPEVSLPNSINADPEKALFENEQEKIIEEALSSLTQEERIVISGIYGLNGVTLSLKNIANQIHYSINDVKIIHQRALNKLRHSAIGEWLNIRNPGQRSWHQEKLEFFPSSSNEDNNLEKPTFVSAENNHLFLDI